MPPRTLLRNPFIGPLPPIAEGALSWFTRTMKPVHRPLRLVLAVMLLAGLLAGCASVDRVNWKARVGTYSYDDAVKEFGPPDKKETLSDGTIVSEWILERAQLGPGPGFGWGGGYGWGRYGRPYRGSVWVESQGFPEQLLRLQFGADGKLREEKRYSR